MAIIMLAV